MYRLIYCGKTKRLDRRFYSHFHAKDIQKENANRISVCKCGNDKSAEKLEKRLLSKLDFPVNEKDNGSPEYPDVTKVVEAF